MERNGLERDMKEPSKSDGNSLYLVRDLGYRCMYFPKLRACTLKVYVS